MSEENKNGEQIPEIPEKENKPVEEPWVYEVKSEATSSQQTSFSYDGTKGAMFESNPQSLPKKKKKKTVSLTAFVISAIALVVAAVMMTYTVCNSVYQKKLADGQITVTTPTEDLYYPFDLFRAMLQTYSFEELNEDEMMAAALKAYVYATGDRYAAYYTAEEYELLKQSTAGNTEGIGINVINTTITAGGVEYKVIRVINVMTGSPAEQAGVKVGDAIYGVGHGDSMETVDVLGYDVALTKLQGTSGTQALFTVLRQNESGWQPVEFTITRAAVTTTSVYSRVSDLSSEIGVIKIVQFDLTTPSQLSKAVDDLSEKGCTKFVFDVRYNPGGDLASIEAVLSYFLEKDDVIIRTADKSGKETISTVGVRNYTGDYAACNVSESDIGKYRGLNCVVICNGSTASAAELFVATFRDYKLAPIVGTTTFGKGSMQSIFSLLPYGYSGALKLTTAKYYPASGVGYDGEGITPDIAEELNQAAAEKNVYELPDAEDNQLQKAIAALK